MPVSDFEALRKWAKIPKDIQRQLLRSVYCSNCGMTLIGDYTLRHDKYGVLIEGKCKKCGKDVARLLEDCLEPK